MNLYVDHVQTSFHLIDASSTRIAIVIEMNIVHDISNGQEPYPISLVYDNIDELEESKREHQKVISRWYQYVKKPLKAML